MAEQAKIRPLILPRYSYRDADYLANASPGTARRWLTGYTYRDREGHQVTVAPVTPGSAKTEGASFLDLVEVVAIAGLRQSSFSMRDIRQIVANCQEILGVSRPLASLNFKVSGKEIFVERGGALVEVGKRKRRQAWKEFLEPFLNSLDYAADLDLAVRWWPLGKDAPILVDPEYGYGLPVVANSGVRTEIIRERSLAGDLNEQIARDFNLCVEEVERALQFELKLAA